MSLLIKGITRISELDIDADKDMTVHGLFNLKEVVAAMLRGDIAVKDTSQLVVVPAGPADYVLTSTGFGKIPVYAPAGGGLKYYFPVVISSVNAESVIAAPDHSIPKNAALATVLAAAYDDAPALRIRRFDPTLASVNVENVIAAADQSVGENERVKSALSILCDGFVEETAAGVQTDHTVQARDVGVNDLNLCPMSGDPLGLLDKIYIGSNYPFWQAQIQVGTNGAGNWLNAAYYWNGAAWVACVDENDGSSSFLHGTGLKFISHTPQAGWALRVIQLMNLYWMMIRTDNYVNQAIKPLGNTVWVAIA